MKKIVFDGGYTLWSAGDDAPLGFMLERLRAVLPTDTEYLVLARHPNKEFDDHFGITTVHNLEHETKEASMGRWFNGLNFVDDRSYLAKVAETVRTADLLVLGAGNFLTEVGIDVLRGHLSRFAVMILMADFFKVPVMLFGLSANKLTNVWTQSVGEWMLNRATAVTFREKEAIRNLEDSGLKLPKYTLLPDAAIGAPQPKEGRGKEILIKEGIPLNQRGKRLAISVRDMSWRSKEVHDSYIAETVKLIDLWNQRTGNDIIFIPQCSYNADSHITDDRYLANQIKSRTRNPENVYVVEGYYQYQDIESLYDDVQITLATRLHGNVFSALRGTPVVGLAYEDKVRGFFERINLLHLCLNLESTAEVVLAKLDEVDLNRDQIKLELKENISSLQKELDGYIDIALSIMK